MMNCQRFQNNQTCYTCSQCCGDDSDNVCEHWTPCRGGHPSTPNPCELTNLEDYPLCLNECSGCENCPE